MDPDTGRFCGFLGWYTASGDLWSFNTSQVVADITLFARWEAPHVLVRFEANEGLPSPPDQYLALGAKAKEPPAMIREGFGFGGWFIDEAFTRRWSFDTPIDIRDTYDTNNFLANFVLYARWVRDVVPPTEIVRQIRIVGVYYIDFAGNSTVFNGAANAGGIPGGGGTTNLTPLQITGNNNAITAVTNIMRVNPEFILQLSGHANPVNPDDPNEMGDLRWLSTKRADAVLDVFKDRGVPQGSMINIGFNDKLYGDSAHGNLNRVVEIIIMEIITTIR